MVEQRMPFAQRQGVDVAKLEGVRAIETRQALVQVI